MRPDLSEGATPERTWWSPTPNWIMRSLLPFAAILLLLSTIWVGPIGFFCLALAWWQFQRRIY